MKKTAILLLSTYFLSACSLSESNLEQLNADLDEIRRYEYAIVSLPNGDVIEGEIDNYYTDMGGFKVVFRGGKTYFTSLENIVLVKEVTK